MPARSLIAIAGAVALAAFPAFAQNPSAEALSLAKQVADLSHRETLARDSYAKELHAWMAICKGDQKCQADLDRAIVRAATEVAEKSTESTVQIMARKLTLSQLQAMLRFYRSPDGQAIAAAQSQLSDEMAQIGLAAQATAQRIISESFCPSHPEICVNAVGQHQRSSPKS
jgi:hypothetical protein